MAKRRISEQQRLRINQQQQQRAQDQAIKSGTVIAHYGRYTDVLYHDQVYQCKLRQHLGEIVAGDRVNFILEKGTGGVVAAIQDRKSRLFRIDERGQEKLIAANIDQVFIVMAPVPEPSWLLLDAYLAAVTYLQLSPVIIFNKQDLSSPIYDSMWQIYQALDIPILKMSAVTKEGTLLLQQIMQDKMSVFVGQSGVGKSSLIQTLLPEERLTVGNLHHSTGLGTHTTSTARFYQLPTGGALIDSPGIRDFSLWKMRPAELARGFSEFLPYVGQCKFRNCSHAHEPGCELQAAVSAGKIALSRWDNYHALLKRFTE